MSTILVDELFPGVVFTQKFKIPRRTNVKHIRSKIYKQGTLVDGVFVCEIKQNGNLLKRAEIDHSLINTIPDTYAHGFIRFDFENVNLQIDEGQIEQEYQIDFYMDNHTEDLVNFIAISREYENPVYVRYGDVDGNNNAVNSSVESAGVEIYTTEYLNG